MSTKETPRLTPGTEIVVQMIIIKGVRYHGPKKGILKSIDGENTVVEFRVPVNPYVCASCGSHSGLSRNGATGQVTCMRSGCGHDHGFELVEVDFLKLSSLVPAGEYARLVRETEWQEKVKLRRREVDWAQNALNELLKEGKQNGWKE